MRSSLYSDAQHTARLSADSFQPACQPASLLLFISGIIPPANCH